MNKLYVKDIWEKVVNAVFILYGIIFIYRFIEQLFLKYHYDHPGFSEFFINYEAGFVRRGLMGEFFLLLCKNTGLEPYYFVLSFAAISFMLLFMLFAKEFYKRKLPWPMLLMVFFVAGFVTDGGSWMRKDCIMMLGFFFSIVTLCGEAPVWRKCIVVNLWTTAMILSHEAYVFFSIPIISLVMWSSMFNKSMKKTFLSLIPSFLAFLMTFYFKGNIVMANEIWDTWKPWIGNEVSMGVSLYSLGWETGNTILYHLNLNFIEPISRSVPVPSVVKWVFLTAVVFYLLTTTFYMYDDSTERDKRRKFIVTIAFLQFLFMLPLFTILSCDYLRIVHYWTISTVSIYLFVPKRVIMDIIPSWLTNIISSIIKLIPESKIVFYIILIIIGAYQHSTMYINSIG